MVTGSRDEARSASDSATPPSSGEGSGSAALERDRSRSPARLHPGRGGALSRLETYFLHVSNLLVGITGLVYGWMRYFAESEDEWAIVNHPWQPDVQHLHVLTAPLLVFGVGLLWRDHVWGRYRRGVRARRRSGLGLALMFLPMALSGYLVQVVTEDEWRVAWAWVHGITSLLWIAGYVVHQVARRRTHG